MKKTKYINLAIILSLIMALTLAACRIDIDGIISGDGEETFTNPSSQGDTSNPSQSGDNSQTSEIDEVPTLTKQEEAADVLNGKYVYHYLISEGVGNVAYMYNLLDGVPQPMGTHMETFGIADGGTVTFTETTLAYWSNIEQLDLFRPVYHVWAAGVECSNCSDPDIGAHPWSGEWEDDIIFFQRNPWLVPIEEWEEMITKIVP